MNEEKAITEETQTTATPEPEDGQERAAEEAQRTTRTFTQEEVEKILASRLKRKEREVEERLRKEQEQAQMSELERLRAELDEWRGRAASVQRQAAERQAQAIAVEALADAGVPAGRRQYALRMLDLSDAVSEDGVEESAVLAEVKKLVSEIPELAGRATSRAGAEFSGQGTADLTEEAIANMSVEELKRRWTDIQNFYSKRNR